MILPDDIPGIVVVMTSLGIDGGCDCCPLHPDP